MKYTTIKSLLKPSVFGFEKRFKLLYFLKLIGCIPTAFIFLFSLGNKEKAKIYHFQTNPIMKLKQRIIKKYMEKKSSAFDEKYLKDDRYDFGGIFLPRPSHPNDIQNIPFAYDEVIKIFIEYQDNYNWKLVNKLEKK